MNHDPTAAADSARLSRHDDDSASDSDADANVNANVDADATPSPTPSPSTSRRRQSSRSRPRRRRRRSSSRVRRAKAGIARKLDFMTNLMSSLDVLVFAELSVLYYMEYVVPLAPLFIFPVS